MKRDPNYRWNRELQKAFDGVAFQIGNVQGVHRYSSADRGIYTTVSSCVLDMIECQLRRYYVTLCTRICMPGNAVQITTVELYKGWDHWALDYWPRLAFECVIRGQIRCQPYNQPIIPSRILYPPLPPSFSYESVRCEAQGMQIDMLLSSASYLKKTGKSGNATTFCTHLSAQKNTRYTTRVRQKLFPFVVAALKIIHSVKYFWIDN